MTIRRAARLVLILLTLAGAGLVAAWYRNGWDLDAAAAVGDAVAPIVGVLSLLAVAAALWSVQLQHEALEAQEGQLVEQQKAVDNQLRLQNEALELQRQALAKQDEQIRQQVAAQNEGLELQREALARQDEQIRSQQEALTDQLSLQRQAIEQQKQELLHQHEALEIQLRYQRHAALREAYAPFLSAVAIYEDAVHHYFSEMLRTNCQADSRTRSEWQKPSLDALQEIKRTHAQVLLVDTSETRRGDRWRLSRPIRLEPRPDTLENQQLWLDVLLHRLSEHTAHLVALRTSLHEEFGNAVTESPTKSREFDEKLRADLKEKARAAEQRISAQLTALVKEEARRTGCGPATPPLEDDEVP